MLLRPRTTALQTPSSFTNVRRFDAQQLCSRKVTVAEARPVQARRNWRSKESSLPTGYEVYLQRQKMRQSNIDFLNKVKNYDPSKPDPDLLTSDYMEDLMHGVTEKDYFFALKEHAKSGNISFMEDLLEKMKKLPSFKFTAPLLHLFLMGHAVNQNFEGMMNVLDKMVLEHVPVTQDTFNKVLTYFGEHMHVSKEQLSLYVKYYKIKIAEDQAPVDVTRSVIQYQYQKQRQQQQQQQQEAKTEQQSGSEEKSGNASS